MGNFATLQKKFVVAIAKKVMSLSHSLENNYIFGMQDFVVVVIIFIPID
jgi:hypothetical protein